MGYHYPRSLGTAERSAQYFRRFMDEFGWCVKTDFDQVYATSAAGSWTNADQFYRFCEAAGIPCEELPASRYFKPGLVDGAFLTKEYTYDAQLLGTRLVEELGAHNGVGLRFNSRITGNVRQQDGEWLVPTNEGMVCAPAVLNATYASINQVNRLFGFPPLDIKYELCEIIFCDISETLRHMGITVMDGPFFSIMPFGMTGLHSLTSVTFTPHDTCHADYPEFPCMARVGSGCSPEQLGNCDFCREKPASAWPYIASLARKYLRDSLDFSYRSSSFSMKPILRASEVDDSRPTVVRTYSESPRFTAVLSGKINTVYDLEEAL